MMQDKMNQRERPELLTDHQERKTYSLRDFGPCYGKNQGIICLNQFMYCWKQILCIYTEELARPFAY